MDNETAPNGHPSWRDYEALAKQLGSVVRANTNTLRLVHAVQMAATKSISEAVSLCSELKGSSAAAVERVAGKLDVLIEVARGAAGAAKEAATESRATNDRLGVTREEIGALRRDLTPPHGVPLEKDDTKDSPPDGITLRHGRVEARWKLSSIGGLVKKNSGWFTSGGIAAWHFAGDHIVAAFRAALHFFGH